MNSIPTTLFLNLCTSSLAFMLAERIPEEGLLCYNLELNTRLKQIRPEVRTVLEARRASKVLYFFKLPDPLERSFSSGSKGRIAQRKGRHIGGADVSFYHDQQGRQVVLHRKRPADQRTLQECARKYRQVLSEMSQHTERRQRSPVPFDFVGARLYPVADEYYPPPYDLQKVRAGYELNPSDLAALVYLEVALVERDLAQYKRSESVLQEAAGKPELLDLVGIEWDADQLEKLRKTLDEAVERLNLLNIDFRKDVEFRQHLHESFNFDRPECVLLFLAGDAAARQGKAKLAEKYYSVLIERAPGSPFAWEAFCKLPRLPDVDQERVKRLEEVLVGTYPLVWGCRRDALRLEPSKVKSTISTLLRTVEPQRVPRSKE